ncbi:MAG TPA: hypothetical protein EYN66_24470, partial [Myxococcales bacterium]|nr:hypothetical protein [Myxococcales bacterium]
MPDKDLENQLSGLFRGLDETPAVEKAAAEPVASDSLTIAENERRFVAQELHDHVIQTLLQINMQVSICKRYLELDITDETASELDLLEGQIMTASQQLRDLIADLRSPTSEDGTFQSMLEKQIEIHHQRGGPTVTLSQNNIIELSATKKLALTRIIQESLHNIRKHANASKVDLILKTDNSRLKISVTDDGQGFD